MSSSVYFLPTGSQETPESLGRKAVKLFEAAGFGSMISEGKLIAVKQHFGEGQGIGYLKPPVARAVVGAIKGRGGKPFLTETATLYRGRRSNAVDHLNLAYEHGFTPDAVGCPVIMADGLVGAAQVDVTIDKKHYKEVPIAADIAHTHALVALTHVTGHLAAGIGGAIKNIGMGLSSRAGKMKQHHDSIPLVDPAKCVACRTCVEWCPAEAITVNDVAVIDESKCIGCGECLAVCPVGAVGFQWGEEAHVMQEKMAEHALGVARKLPGRIACLNFATYVTCGCDCFGNRQAPVTPDLGILASTDMVAVDLATVELINRQAGKDLFKEMYPEFDWDVQIRHGEEIGLGSRDYKLIEVK